MAFDDQKKISFIPGFSGKNRLEWRKRALLFTIFLAISALIWTINALSKEYTTEIEYPIKYSKLPPGKMLIREKADYLNLTVTSDGFTLLKYKITNRPIPINFHVSSFGMNSLSGDTSSFYLLTRYASQLVDDQLPTDLKLLDISPDTLIFHFARKIQKTLPVEPDIQYELAKGFTLKGKVEIVPASVSVSGPDIYLDTIKSIKTVRKNIGLLSKSYSEEIVLVEKEGFEYDNESVSCNIELEKLTEVQVNVPIQVVGLPDSLRIQIFPSEVKVSGLVGLSYYDRVLPEAFWAAVDYQEVIDNKSRLQVQLRNAPNFLQGINFYPQSVEYILSAK